MRIKQQRVLQCSSLWQRHGDCGSARGIEEVAAVQEGTKVFAAVREAQSCCRNAEAEEGAQDSSRESFSIKRASSLTRLSVVG